MVASNLETIAQALHAAAPPAAGPDSTAAPAVGEPGLTEKKRKKKDGKMSKDDGGSAPSAQHSVQHSAPSAQQAQQQNGLVHGRKHDKRKNGGTMEDAQGVPVPCDASVTWSVTESVKKKKKKKPKTDKDS